MIKVLISVILSLICPTLLLKSLNDPTSNHNDQMTMDIVNIHTLLRMQTAKKAPASCLSLKLTLRTQTDAMQIVNYTSAQYIFFSFLL